MFGKVEPKKIIIKISFISSRPEIRVQQRCDSHYHVICNEANIKHLEVNGMMIATFGLTIAFLHGFSCGLQAWLAHFSASVNPSVSQPRLLNM